MSVSSSHFPAAISRLSDGEVTREAQNIRAIRWLLQQPGGEIVVITPQKSFDSRSLSKLVARRGVVHLTWRGLSPSALTSRRVLYAWPDRAHLNDIWGVKVDALVVIEWSEDEMQEWIEDVNPLQLFCGGSVVGSSTPKSITERELLPNNVEEILEYIAGMAAGYSSGLKWDEVDKLKADMINRPARWSAIEVEQVRLKCRELRMRPRDIDTITDLLQRRKEGRRFNVQSSYRTFFFK